MSEEAKFGLGTKIIGFIVAVLVVGGVKDVFFPLNNNYTSAMQ